MQASPSVPTHGLAAVAVDGPDGPMAVLIGGGRAPGLRTILALDGATQLWGPGTDPARAEPTESQSR